MRTGSESEAELAHGTENYDDDVTGEQVGRSLVEADVVAEEGGIINRREAKPDRESSVIS